MVSFITWWGGGSIVSDHFVVQLYGWPLELELEPGGIYPGIKSGNPADGILAFLFPEVVTFHSIVFNFGALHGEKVIYERCFGIRAEDDELQSYLGPKVWIGYNNHISRQSQKRAPNRLWFSSLF